jgi:hypothetical protein
MEEHLAMGKWCQRIHSATSSTISAKPFDPVPKSRATSFGYRRPKPSVGPIGPLRTVRTDGGAARPTLHAPPSANLILFDHKHRQLVGVVVSLADDA